jgi:hypothetical protein
MTVTWEQNLGLQVALLSSSTESCEERPSRRGKWRSAFKRYLLFLPQRLENESAALPLGDKKSWDLFLLETRGGEAEAGEFKTPSQKQNKTGKEM